ncbi:methylated-DNA--[protein]-cysteine S-methyltransferase [Paenibacillus sp. CC-CFT747]|nr:methylated-DNA--[protein]-cysteine S-methyltransferase [Paenibacillus sp. CC-CFT747]
MTPLTPIPVYWSAFSPRLFGKRPLYVAATEKGICRITWPDETFEALQDWVTGKMPGARLEEAPEELRSRLLPIEEYLEGSRRELPVRLDLRGTPFQLAVWEALRQIPYGETRSYSDIAAAVGRPAAVRAVGTANGANPVPLLVPCHRVIGKSGSLTGFRGGLQAKELLLGLEGVHDYKRTGHARYSF